MINLKELRSIELTSFTIMNTGIAIIFSIISAILISIGILLLVPTGSSIIIYMIPTIIIGTFITSIYISFSDGLFYNLLAKKLKTIAIELHGGEITKISTTETAMMISIILTIQAVLLYLVTILILPLLLSTGVQTLLYSGQQVMAYTLYQFLVVISQPVTILIFIFGTFIISFIFILIGTYIYNILAKNGRGAVLMLSNENGLTSIDSIDALKLGIVFAIISGILNLILAVIMIISGSPMTTIGNVLGGFVGGFIEAYLFAIFYNFLAPKIGKMKFELIDLKIN